MNMLWAQELPQKVNLFHPFFQLNKHYQIRNHWLMSHSFMGYVILQLKKKRIRNKYQIAA